MRSAEDAVTKSEWKRGHKKAGFLLIFMAVTLVTPFVCCQMAQKQQKNADADHAAALANMLKRNQAITDLIPSLSEWIHNPSFEGKQLKKPYPTLDELKQRIGAPNNTETLAPPGKPATLMTARWYYGTGTDRADLALEAELLEEGGIWRLNGISFWRGKGFGANTMEYIGRDVMYWKGTRYDKR
jgi:hypothetical protein